MVSRILLLTCVVLLISGGWLSISALTRPSAEVEFVAGMLIIGGLVLLGYTIHKIMFV